MFYNSSTQEQKSLKDLKVLLNASIPSSATQVGDDWFLLHYGTPPTYDAATQKAVSDGIKLVDGIYTTTYRIEPLTEDELAAAAEAAQQQAIAEAEQALVEAKQTRAEAVSNITVEVDGMVFDGDETAQGRMSRVVAIAGDDEQSTILQWVLADNTVESVTVAQIKEALRKALHIQAALWVVPYADSADK